jgi:DNA-binding CsgD family transcriptional regulator
MHEFRRNKLIALVYFLSVIAVHAQNDGPVIDSLLQELEKKTLSSNAQIEVGIQLGKEFAESNPETGLGYIEQSFRLLNRSPNDSLFVHALIAKSTAYSYLAQYDSSTRLAIEAIGMASQQRDTIALLDANNNLGIDFMYTEDYESSYHYLNELIRLAQLVQDSLRLGHGLNNLGLVEYYLGNEEKELACYLQAQGIFERIGEKEGLGNTILNIGTIYTSGGDHLLAQEYYKRALTIFDQLGYQSAYANVLQSISEDYMEQQKFKKAEQIAFEALEIVKRNELKQDIAYVYDLIQKIQISKGDYQKAHEYLALYHEENDEIFNEEKSRQVKELQTKYETSKKEAEIARLGLDNQLQEMQLSKAENKLIAASIIGLLILVGSVLFYIMRNKRIEIERIANDQQIDALKQRVLELQLESAAMESSYNLEDLNGKLQTPLTEREHDALALSLQGKSNKEIADALFVSVNTIKFHLRNIYQKLGVSNKKEIREYVVKSS